MISHWKEELFQVLNTIDTPYNVILDQHLHLLLEPHLRNKTSVRSLSENIERDNKINIYIIQPNGEIINMIISCINSSNNESRIYFVPKFSLMYEDILRAKLNRYVEISSLPLNLFPICQDMNTSHCDVVTINIPNGYSKYILLHDLDCQYNIAQALIDLQSMMGKVNSIKCIGKYAERINTLIQKRAFEIRESYITEPEYDEMRRSWTLSVQNYIIDRSVDMMTPMIFSLIYGDCVNENNSDIIYNPDDLIFNSIKYLPITEVGQYLQTQIQERIDFNNIDLYKLANSDLRDFVKQIPIHKKKLQYLDMHIDLSKNFINNDDYKEQYNNNQEIFTGNYLDIKEIIDNYMISEADLYLILKLLIITSLYRGTFNSKSLDNIKREFLQVYGYQYLQLFINLEKLGLLQKNKQYRNIIRDGDYYPLSIDLVKKVYDKEKRTVIIFVGGVTFYELKLLKEFHNGSTIITEYITGSGLLKSLA